MALEIDKIINNIDFINLNSGLFHSLLVYLQENRDKFKKAYINEPVFSETRKELRKYKIEMISILYQVVFQDKLLQLPLTEELTYDDKLNLLSIPFITPINIEKYKKNISFTKEDQYINLNVLEKKSTIDTSNLIDIENVLLLYSNPDSLFKYCFNSVTNFITKFKKHTKKNETQKKFKNGKPKLIYSYP